MDISRNEEENKSELRKPFFMASDEGYIWSSDVNAIKKSGEERTYLVRRDLNTAYVDAPVEVVRAFFEERGYEFVSEGDLKKRAEDYKAYRPK